jgi:hypothetical protein
LLQDFGALIVSKGRLAAYINHSLNTVWVTDQATGGIKLFRSFQLGNTLVNMARTSQNVNGIRASQKKRVMSKS